MKNQRDNQDVINECVARIETLASACDPRDVDVRDPNIIKEYHSVLDRLTDLGFPDLGKFRIQKDKDDKDIVPNIQIFAFKRYFTTNGISIRHLKNPHKQYWEMVWHNAFILIKKHKIVSMVIVGLIIAYLSYYFGWN